jgi:RND family efflux transporter MFP subunit
MAKSAPGRQVWKGAAALAAAAGLGLAVGFVAFGGGPSGKEAESGPAAAADGGRGGGGFGGQRPPPVAFATVTSAPVDESLTAIGTGRAIQSLALSADVSGNIVEVLIAPGATVDEGAPLIRLESREQEIALARARADYGIAKTNAARFEGLRETEAASALEFEAARNQMTAATAALRQAEFDLDRRTIRAPFAGVLGLTTLAVGDYLTAGARLTTIDDVSSLLVDFVVPENASPYVTPGLKISAAAQANDGRGAIGEIRAVDSRVDPTSRTRRVEAILPNPDRALVPGSTFRITLAIAGRRGVIVPGLAVQWDRAGAFVWKVAADGTAERTPVVILKREAGAVLLDAGLEDGAEIVAEGADLVRAGVPLRRAGGEGVGGAASAR